MRQLLIAAALLLALGCERPNPFFSERKLGAGGILLSAPPFSGGTLSAPLVLDATNTLCSEALALSFSGDADLGVKRSAANILLLCASGAALTIPPPGIPARRCATLRSTSTSCCRP